MHKRELAARFLSSVYTLLHGLNVNQELVSALNGPEMGLELLKIADSYTNGLASYAIGLEAEMARARDVLPTNWEQQRFANRMRSQNHDELSA